MNRTVSIEKVVGSVHFGDAPEHNIDSVINEILVLIAEGDLSWDINGRKPSVDTISKIKYNELGSKSSIIRQYLRYSQKVETSFNAIDALIPFGKNKILSSLNDLYYEALDFVGIDYLLTDISIEQVRANSSSIIEFITEKLHQTAYESKNKPKLKEDLDVGINVVIAHAFIECVVLETPS